MIVRGLEPGGRLVLNADDAELTAAAGRLDVPILWFSLDAANPRVKSHLAAGGEACFLEDGVLVLARGGRADGRGAGRGDPPDLGGGGAPQRGQCPGGDCPGGGGGPAH